MDFQNNHILALPDVQPDMRDIATRFRTTSAGSNSPRSYSGGVSDYELDSMSLTSSVCRTVNGRMRKNYRKQAASHGHMEIRNATRANDAFFVKTGHERFYGSSLTFPHSMTLIPTSVCPDVDAHDELILEHDLPLACPTCWSAQRNGTPARLRNRANKKRSSKSQHCKSKAATVCT